MAPVPCQNTFRFSWKLEFRTIFFFLFFYFFFFFQLQKCFWHPQEISENNKGKRGLWSIKIALELSSSPKQEKAKLQSLTLLNWSVMSASHGWHTLKCFFVLQGLFCQHESVFASIISSACSKHKDLACASIICFCFLSVHICGGTRITQSYPTSSTLLHQHQCRLLCILWVGTTTLQWWWAPQGKGRCIPLSLGKPQLAQWGNWDLHLLNPWCLLLACLTRERVGYGVHCCCDYFPLPGLICPHCPIATFLSPFPGLIHHHSQCGLEPDIECTGQIDPLCKLRVSLGPEDKCLLTPRRLSTAK